MIDAEEAAAAAFARALLDADAPVPAGLVAWNGSDPAVRFAVYRNNVVASLTAALADTFDVVRQLVGDAFFATLARHFIAAHPPTSPVLAEYGAALPAYIERFLARHAPTAGLAYLADVARLEFARVRAFHAADVPTLAAEAIAAHAAEPATLASARLQLHPSLTVVISRHAVASLWAAHQGVEAAPPALEDIDPAQPDAALVLRADDDAAVLRVPHAVARFVAALQAGTTLGDAAAQASHPVPADGIAFDLAAAFGVLLHHPLVVAWQAPGPEGPNP